MTSAQRIALLVGAVIILGGAFVLASGSDDDATVATATTPAETATVITTPTPTTDAPQASVEPAPAPAPEFDEVVVRDGKPAGGLKTIKARKGDRVRIEVSSPDTTGEVHLHGYDVSRDLAAGGTVRFSFDANLEGIFEMELEETAVPIAKIEISPS